MVCGIFESIEILFKKSQAMWKRKKMRSFKTKGKNERKIFLFLYRIFQQGLSNFNDHLLGLYKSNEFKYLHVCEDKFEFESPRHNL